jgi:hypothetical protein
MRSSWITSEFTVLARVKDSKAVAAFREATYQAGAAQNATKRRPDKVPSKTVNGRCCRPRRAQGAPRVQDR